MWARTGDNKPGLIDDSKRSACQWPSLGRAGSSNGHCKQLGLSIGFWCGRPNATTRQSHRGALQGSRQHRQEAAGAALIEATPDLRDPITIYLCVTCRCGSTVCSGACTRTYLMLSRAREFFGGSCLSGWIRPMETGTARMHHIRNHLKLGWLSVVFLCWPGEGAENISDKELVAKAHAVRMRSAVFR